jgi:hypothetical protein
MKNAVFWDIKTQFVPHRRPLRLRYVVQPVNAILHSHRRGNLKSYENLIGSDDGI